MTRSSILESTSYSKMGPPWRMMIFGAVTLLSLHLLPSATARHAKTAEPARKTVPVADLTFQTEALLKFKRALADPGALPSWTNRTGPCSGLWMGITCSPDNTSVIGMSLRGRKFWGPLPSEMKNMDFLESLVVMNTAFAGQIPKAIQELKRLKSLVITKNPFLNGQLAVGVFTLLHKIEKLQLSWSNITECLHAAPNRTP